MFQVIQQDKSFENRDQKLKEEFAYYAGLPGHFMYEVTVPIHTEILGTDQYDSELIKQVY